MFRNVGQSRIEVARKKERKFFQRTNCVIFIRSLEWMWSCRHVRSLPRLMIVSLFLLKKRLTSSRETHYIVLTMCRIARLDRYRLARRKDLDALTSPDDLAWNDLSYDDPRIT